MTSPFCAVLFNSIQTVSNCGDAMNFVTRSPMSPLIPVAMGAAMAPTMGLSLKTPLSRPSTCDWVLSLATTASVIDVERAAWTSGCCTSGPTVSM